jgi:hypothetical protein
MATTNGSMWDLPFEDDKEPQSHHPAPLFEELVVLHGGTVVPAAAVQLAARLEAAGLRLSVVGDDVVVTPIDRVSPSDRALLKFYRPALRAILTYRAPSPDEIELR